MKTPRRARISRAVRLGATRFRRCVSRSTRRTSARRATSRRAGADARAAPRCAARGGRRRAAGRSAPRRDRGSRGRRARALAFAETLRVLVDDTPRGARALLLRERRSAHLAVRVLRRRRTYIKCLRRWQRTTRSADGGRTCQVCRRVPRAAAVVLRARPAPLARARARPRPSRCCRLGWPWIWRARARRPCSAGAAPWRSPPRAAFLMASACTASPPRTSGKTRTRTSPPWRCGGVDQSGGAQRRRVPRDARNGSEGGASLYVADPMAGWVHFAHDVLNFPHLMTLCYGILCADAERAPAVAAVGAWRAEPGPPRAARRRPGRLKQPSRRLRDARALPPVLTTSVSSRRRAARFWRARGGSNARSRRRRRGGVVVRAGGRRLDAARRDARRFFGDAFVPSR